jgi:phospholipid/cholesterol/gamma-HCH transport system substrate-binding protein
MKVKLSYFEKVAGLFVLIAIVGAVGFTALTAIKQGWFASKVEYTVTVDSADGLHDGTAVQVAGLRAGQVTDVDLISANTVKVHMQVLEKFKNKIRDDSRAQILRPFVLGDKVIEISMGSEDAEPLIAGAEILSIPVFYMMDLMSVKKLAPFMGSLDGLMVNLSTLAKAFADPKRTQTFIKLFDRMDPLLRNMNSMSTEVTSLTRELNHIIPELRKTSPQIGQQLANMLMRLETITAALTPAVQEVGPDLPRVSRRAVEALDEMVVTLKAMQKSFLLSGKVEDVREEENARQRKPAEK